MCIRDRVNRGRKLICKLVGRLFALKHVLVVAKARRGLSPVLISKSRYDDTLVASPLESLTAVQAVQTVLRVLSSVHGFHGRTLATSRATAVNDGGIITRQHSVVALFVL